MAKRLQRPGKTEAGGKTGITGKKEDRENNSRKRDYHNSARWIE